MEFHDILGIYKAHALCFSGYLGHGSLYLYRYLPSCCCLLTWTQNLTSASLSCPRFVVVCGDGEYIIYTAMALRNKSFGSAQEFVWAHDSSE